MKNIKKVSGSWDNPKFSGCSALSNCRWRWGGFAWTVKAMGNKGMKTQTIIAVDMQSDRHHPCCSIMVMEELTAITKIATHPNYICSNLFSGSRKLNWNFILIWLAGCILVFSWEASLLFTNPDLKDLEGNGAKKHRVYRWMAMAVSLPLLARRIIGFVDLSAELPTRA